MRVLITGSTGALACEVIKYFESSRNDEVFLTSRSKLFFDNHICCDLMNPSEIQKMIAYIRPDLILHLAGSFENNLALDFPVNALSAGLIAEQIIENNNDARLVLIGSAAEYGVVEYNENPVSETRALRPRSIYGLTKAAQTGIAEFYTSIHDVDIVVARLFNLYGRGLSNRLFVGSAEHQIEKYKNSEINELVFGSLETERDYLSISDAAKMIVQVATKGIKGTIYNIGSGRAVKIKEILYKMLNEDNLTDVPIIEKENTGFGSNGGLSCIFADISRYKAISQD